MQRASIRLMSLVLCLLMVITMLPAQALAADDWDSNSTGSLYAVSDKSTVAGGGGKCGDNLTWTLDDTGLLTISGTGDMWDYYYDSQWKNYTVKNAVIENGVTSIGEYAFYYCTSLTSITIPSGVTSIGVYAFANCNSLTYTVYGDCKYLGNEGNPYHALIGTTSDPITDASIHKSTKVIADCAFSSCTSLTSITIPDSVTSIGDYAFYGCSSLTSITIPDSVTSIGDWAFYGCTSLTSITIPDSVNSIEYGAFRGCTSLTSITIPDSVTSIGDRAFSGCAALNRVFYAGTEEQWNAINIGNYNDDLLNAEIQFNWTASVYGTLTTFAGGTATLTVALGGETVSTMELEDGSYRIDGLAPGDYTLTLSKANHGDRSYSLTLAAGETEQDLELHLLGDISGDGKINIGDVAKIYAHMKGGAQLEDYALVCADMNGDGKITIGDTAKAYAILKGA